MTKYYVDNSGKYLGGFDGAQPPEGSVEIPSPPEHGEDILINGVWDKSGRAAHKLDTLETRAEAVNTVEALRAVVKDLIIELKGV